MDDSNAPNQVSDSAGFLKSGMNSSLFPKVELPQYLDGDQVFDHEEQFATPKPKEAVEVAAEEVVKKSTNLRSKGNSIYFSARQGNVSNLVVISRYEQALNLFFQADANACNADEKSSALKNISVVHKALADVNETNVQKCQYHYLQAFENAKLAIQYSIGVKNDAWTSSLRIYVRTIWENFIEFLRDKSGKDFDTRALAMLEIECFLTDELRLDNYAAIFDLYYKSSVTSANIDEAVMAKNAIMECYFPLQEAKRIARATNDDDMLEQVAHMEEDYLFQHQLCEAEQIFQSGWRMHQSSVYEEEQLNVDELWNAADLYRQAIVLSREYSLEIEAKCCAYLGQIYYNCLGLKRMAHDLFLHCIELAESLRTPLKIYESDWFKVARNGLQSYRDWIKDEEERIQQEERQPFLDELKKELDEIATLVPIKLGSRITFEIIQIYLRHIYKEHPPKNNKVLREDKVKDKTKVRMVLTSALSHYHPDKQDVDEHGMKWKVLCEEISKALTRLFNHSKGIEDD